MKKILIPIISLILFSGIGLLLAANQGYFGYGISNASLLAKLGSAGAITPTSVSKVEEHGVCKTVTSNDARLLFIPTRTPAERSTFITNKPSHITLGICGCTTNADCSAGQTCQNYEPPIRTCAGTQTNNGSCGIKTTAGSCSNGDYPTCAVFSSYATCQDRTICGSAMKYITCKRNGSSCSTITSQSTCGSTAGCSVNTTSQGTPGTCAVVGSCGSANGGTYPNLTSASSNLCIGTTVTNFNSFTSYWTRNCGTANCSATKATTPGGCFKEGTQILLPNGTTTNIENIQIGDILIGPENSNNKVLRLFKLPKDNRKMYSINNSDYFVTDTHPFMTLEGWKSFNPKGTAKENPSLIVSDFEIGDMIITNKGIETLYNIDSIEWSGYVYNFMLDNSRTYYADGYLVHNVQDPSTKLCTSAADCGGHICCGDGSCATLENGAYTHCP